MELGVGREQGSRDPDEAGNDDIGRKSSLSERFKQGATSLIAARDF